MINHTYPYFKMIRARAFHMSIRFGAKKSNALRKKLKRSKEFDRRLFFSFLPPFRLALKREMALPFFYSAGWHWFLRTKPFSPHWNVARTPALSKRTGCYGFR